MLNTMERLSSGPLKINYAGKLVYRFIMELRSNNPKKKQVIDTDDAPSVDTKETVN